jgi:hypothetical protein
MSSEVMVRPGYGEEPDWTKPFWCEDWQCPAWAECEHHFGRSYAYAAMIPWWEAKLADKTPYHTPARPPFGPCQYFRRDIPREWLKGWCEPQDKSWCCIGCNLPECPRAPSNVVSIFGGSA